jgi:hypothetical protein
MTTRPLLCFLGIHRDESIAQRNAYQHTFVWRCVRCSGREYPDRACPRDSPSSAEISPLQSFLSRLPSGARPMRKT